MTNVLVRDLTEETHRELLRRAEACGQSLQHYLAAELTRLARSLWTTSCVGSRLATAAGSA